MIFSKFFPGTKQNLKAEPEIIPWDKSYEIGHELIDSQHRIFLMILNKLIKSIAQGVTKEYMFRTLMELKKYAEFHFISEENVMLDCGYLNVNQHQHIHSELLFEFTVLSDRVAQGRAEPDEVVSFIKGWLLNHILHEDIQIAQYVRRCSDN
ncbi:MAG: hemerythrin family protein [Methylophilaceae bacterium]